MILIVVFKWFTNRKGIKKMLNVKTTKSLKAYANKGLESVSIYPIYNVVMECDNIPTEYKLPFTLQVVNRFMNGGSPAGFQYSNGMFFNCVKDARNDFITNPETISMCYSRVRLSTLVRWSQAIEFVNNI